jgi:DNA topoisomerase I
VPRLRRSDPGSPGFTRRRRGEGWQFLDVDGEVITDPEVVERCTKLVIPPAWADVWICPDDRGHVQATGMDAAGRRQYRYHEDWHLQRAREKFDSMLDFGRALPVLRERVEDDLARREPDAQKVLAATVRLLDRGFFRIGSEDYAERNQTYGLATMRREHVRVSGQAILFDFAGKHGVQQVSHVVDPETAAVVTTLKRRRDDAEELLAYKEGGRWHDIRSSHINHYLKDRSGLDVTAKDFRTWGATVLASVGLAVSGGALRTKTARQRAEKRTVDEVARYLGNTPTVARSSYIDPRVFDRFANGLTIADALGDDMPTYGDPATQGPVEAAVIELIEGEVGVPAFGAAELDVDLPTAA